MNDCKIIMLAENGCVSNEKESLSNEQRDESTELWNNERIPSTARRQRYR